MTANAFGNWIFFFIAITHLCLLKQRALCSSCTIPTYPGTIIMADAARSQRAWETSATRKSSESRSTLKSTSKSTWNRRRALRVPAKRNCLRPATASNQGQASQRIWAACPVVRRCASNTTKLAPSCPERISCSGDRVAMDGAIPAAVATPLWQARSCRIRNRMSSTDNTMRSISDTTGVIVVSGAGSRLASWRLKELLTQWTATAPMMTDHRGT